MIVDVRIKVYLTLRKIVVVMMNRYLQSQILANRHVLSRKDCRTREIVISHVNSRNVSTLRMKMSH